MSTQLNTFNTEKTHAKPHILIVDDQAINIQTLYAILADQYEVYMATNGKEAIALSKTIAIDLFLVDINMPVMDGIELCRELKKNEDTQELPVVFMTASNSIEDEGLCWDVGGADFVSKPVNPKTLKKRVSYHLMMKEQTRLLRELSFVDSLTNIANRRLFDEQLAKVWRYHVRSKLPLSIILMDVDFFKQYNDNYGHQAGDDCLQKIAAALKSSIYRSLDVVARYGGEEFICLLPETDELAAFQIAERLADAVHELNLPHDYSTVSPKVTLSLGLATSKDCQHLNAEQLLKLADLQLYEAKMQGRARICKTTI